MRKSIPHQAVEVGWRILDFYKETKGFVSFRPDFKIHAISGKLLITDKSLSMCLERRIKFKNNYLIVVRIIFFSFLYYLCCLQ
jgi:hypothetical protein